MSIKKVPVVPRWKVLLNIPRFIDNPIPILNETIEALGDTYVTYVGGTTKMIITIDPKLIQYVLQKNHSNYEKSKIQTDDLAKYIGKGLLTTNGSYWLRQRRLIQPGFHKKKLVALVDIMNTEIIAYCNDLEQRIKSESVVDISKEMTEITLRVVSKALFSTGMDRSRMEIIGESIARLQQAIILDIRQPFLKWWRKLNGFDKQSGRVARTTQNLLAQIIAERKASRENHDDLLDMLLGVKYEDTQEHMTDQQILEESLVLFVAGHETSANAMSWSHYLLDKNKVEKDRVCAEIDSLNVAIPNFHQAMSLEIIGNVVSESMRLYPPAWITDRVALSDDSFDGIKIKKGDVVAPYIYGTHNDKSRWKDPHLFIPDRFNPDQAKGREAYSYFPFGGGPRLCIGQQFALIEMQLIIYHLYRKFDFTLLPDQLVEMEPMVTLRPKNGIFMKVSPR